MNAFFRDSLNAAALAGLLLLLAVGEGYAMNANLACPYGDACSPPQTPYLSFRSSHSEDMLFNSGEKIEIVCQSGLRSVALRWTLHRNMVSKPFREGTADPLPANRFAISIATAGLHPGFYDLRVELDSGMENAEKILTKRPVRGVCTFGWKAEDADRRHPSGGFQGLLGQGQGEIGEDPARRQGRRHAGLRSEGDQRIQRHQRRPAGGLRSGRAPREKVESCKVDFAGPDGGRVYGWLAKPEGKGPFPAMLVLPGAGFRPSRGRWSTPATATWRWTSRSTARTWT